MSTINKQFLVRTGVNLPAGTNTTAPLTFQQGVKLTSLVNGSVEWDGYNLYVTELDTYGTTSSSPAEFSRKTIAYVDSTLLHQTVSGITATGTTQSGATVLTTDHSIITTATNEETPFNGVQLPPAIKGRVVRIVNSAAFPITVWPLAAPANMTNGSSTGVVITVNTTVGLYAGMKVVVESGTGEFRTSLNSPNGYATVMSILSSTTFAVDAEPLTPLINATISTNNNTTTINGLSANNAYTMNGGTAVEFIASTDSSWFTTAATTTGSNNGITGITYTPGDIIYADTATTIAGLNDVAVGNVLLSGGVNLPPLYGKVGLTTHVEGILPVANGGTGTIGTGLQADTTTSSGVYDLVNTGATQVNFAGEAENIYVGSNTSTVTLNNDLLIKGDFTVLGQTTTVNSSDTSYGDSVLTLHAPVEGFITTDDGKDLGFKFNYYALDGYPAAVTSGSGNGVTTTLTLAGNVGFKVGSVITVSGVSPGAFNGTYTVTASTPGSVSYASLANGSVTTTGALGTVKTVTEFATTGGTIVSSTLTVTYTGPTLTNGDSVTLFGVAPAGYNDTYTISNVANGSFDVTVATPAGDITVQGKIIIGNRFSFVGIANDTNALEFYKEGVEIASTGVFAGSYGEIKAATLWAAQGSNHTAAEITSGTALKVPARTVFDLTTAQNGTVTQSAVARIDQQTLDSINTGVTYTKSASLYIANAPIAGQNTIITDSYAIQVASGNTLLGGNLQVNGGNITTNKTTFNLLNTSATTVNAFGAATAINIGDAGTVVSIGKNIADSTLQIVSNATAGTATITTTTGVTTANVFNTISTTGNIFGAATTVSIGASSGTANINNVTVTMPNATTVNINGANPVIQTTSTGTVSVFNTNALTGSLFGAATAITIGATSGTITLRNPTVVGSQATVNLWNTVSSTVNAFGAATTLSLATPISQVTNAYLVALANNTTGAVTVNVGTASTSASTLTFGGAITSGTNTIKIGSGTGGTVAFDSGLAGATATLFASSISTVKLAESAATVTIANTGITARTINIATAATSGSNLTFGGSISSGTNTITIGTGATGTASLDVGNASATAVLYPTATLGTVKIAENAVTVSIQNTTTSSVTTNIGTNAGVTTSSNLTFGGATTSGTNTIKIGAGSGGTVILDSGNASVTAKVFPTVGGTGTVTLGGTSLGAGTGVVKLGVSPAQTAAGNEVVTASWVINRATAIDTVQAELTTLSANQVIDSGWDWSQYRSAKYTLGVTQIGAAGTRTQSTELLISSDAPAYRSESGVTSSGTNVTVGSTVGLYPGMTVFVIAGTGEFQANTTVASITNSTTFVVSEAPVVALSGATIKGVLVGSYVSAAAATSSGTTVTVNSTAKLYPGMGVAVTAGTGEFAPDTYVTSITGTTTFVVNTAPLIPLSGGATIVTGTPNIFITEYAALESNSTASNISAIANGSTVQLTATPLSSSNYLLFDIGTISKTIFRGERALIEII